MKEKMKRKIVLKKELLFILNRKLSEYKEPFEALQSADPLLYADDRCCNEVPAPQSAFPHVFYGQKGRP